MRLRGPEYDLRPELYLPIAQSAPRAIGGTLLVRMTTDGRGAVTAVANAVGAVLGPVPEPNFLEDDFRGLTAARRFNAGLMAVVGLLAVAIGAAGIYGTMAFVVARQVRAIGLRMALGASRVQILRGVLRESSSRIFVGLLLGFIASWALARMLSVFVFGIAPTEPGIYALVAVVLMSVGVLAALVPASRAAKVDPVVALRAD